MRSSSPNTIVSKGGGTFRVPFLTFPSLVNSPCVLLTSARVAEKLTACSAEGTVASGDFSTVRFEDLNRRMRRHARASANFDGFRLARRPHEDDVPDVDGGGCHDGTGGE